MADEMNLQQAQNVFADLCKALDSNNWKYKKDETKLKIQCGARGDDLPIDLTILVDAKRDVVRVISMMPMKVPEDKRLEMAVAVSLVNNKLVHGCFDLDMGEGHMFFRMTNSFRDSTLSEELYMYLVLCTCKTVDEYNDKFLMISKGMLSLEQFLKLEEQ